MDWNGAAAGIELIELETELKSEGTDKWWTELNLMGWNWTEL